MPRGDKSSYTSKQKRQAEHIEEGYEHRGVGKGEAERRAWATVNKDTGGGKKSGSGRGKPESQASSRKGGRLGGRAHSVGPQGGAQSQDQGLGEAPEHDPEKWVRRGLICERAACGSSVLGEFRSLS